MIKSWDFKNGMHPSTSLPSGSWNVHYKHKSGDFYMVRRIECISMVSLADYQQEGFNITKAVRI